MTKLSVVEPPRPTELRSPRERLAVVPPGRREERSHP